MKKLTASQEYAYTSDDQDFLKSVYIKTSSIYTFIKYFESKRIPIEMILKGTTLTKSVLEISNGWIDFYENRKLLHNIHRYCKECTIYDWIGL